MAKASFDGRRTRRAPGKMTDTPARLAVLGVFAAAMFPLHAQIKPGADAAAGNDDIPLPLCTAGIMASKQGEAALGLYELGDGQTMIEWVDAATAAESCVPDAAGAKAVPGGGPRLSIDNVSLALASQAGSLFVYNPSVAQGQFQTSLLEPALCESYAGAGDSPLSLSVRDTNGVTRVLHGVEALSYSLANGGLVPSLTSAGAGPLLRCHAVTAANTPLPTGGSLFNGSFESSSDLRVEFLDAQGLRLAANGNDQFVNQPLSSTAGVTYQVLVINDGDGVASNVRVREFIPTAAGSVDPSIQTVGCGPTPQGTAAYCAGGNGAISDNVAALAPGGSRVYTVTRKADGNGARASVSVFTDPTSADDLVIADNSRSLAINLVANQAPIAVGTIANVQRNEGESVNIATATAFSDPDGNTLGYAASGLPAGILINQATGVIAGNLSFSSHGVYNVTVTASDGSLNVAQQFTLTVVNQNGAPVTVGTLPNVVLSEGQLANIQTASGFSDPDGDALVYTITGLPGATPLYDPATGQIFYMLDSSTGGVHQITVTASDGTLTAQQTFTLTVTNVNTNPTLVTPIGDQTNDEGDQVNLNVAGNFDDADAGDALTFSVTSGSLPTGLTLSPAGVISGTIGQTAAGDYTVTITANDGNGGTISDTIDWDVVAVNLAPVTVGTIADRSATESVPFSIQASVIVAAFNDPDGDALTYTVDGPAWIGINSGFLFGTPPAASADDYEITVTATDPDGLDATQTFTLTVNAP